MTETASGAARGGKGARKGLTVQRIHTRDGVHPYDDVTWERRDVVMTNWRDGSVNFEQRGVEFPDFWSVNAANIVTTKYFRGAVGTPQREWSLKQLVDRVVGVYVAAGIKHGYFVTPKDAEIFDHELKHALIHQVFSFNSPVWFNVGTASPQQVSACQPYDALVSTPAGLVPIGRLVEDNAIGTKVYDADGLTRIVATKANGVKDVLRLRTKAGRTLDVTADHLVWQAEAINLGAFVQAGILQAGDALLHVEPGVGGSDRSLVEIDRIEPLGAMEVYDIQTESGEYLSGNLRVHNCFILAVDDTMDSILDWYKEEGLIFKGGSGAGVNLSRIRSSKELLSSGGTASGPVSFMRGADASAGTIKSGGATRRAAKMVVLDVDHPDVEEFIQTKAREEDKIRVLRDAGYDMDLGGADITSVQYQNANNSVRVSDEFMRAVEAGDSFGLAARRTGETIATVDAKDLFRKMAQAAWECADPGIQYDGTINGWHTCPESGRITASNPCFPADQRVVTDRGLVAIGDLVRRAADEVSFAVYTNDVTAENDPQDRVAATVPTRYMITGRNEIVELRFSDGSRLRCTPGHRIWTANRGWVHARDLTGQDQVVRSIQHAPRPMADPHIPAGTLLAARYEKSRKQLQLPTKWDPEFAHYLGWLVGDGSIDGRDSTAATVYGSSVEQETVLPRHHALLTKITGFESKPSQQANGTMQLRATRRAFGEFLRGLGVSGGRAPEKSVPYAIFEAPEDALVSFLQGLFDADGCVVNQQSNGTRYVGLGSRSEELLIGVQELLASLGIASRIYRTGVKTASFHYTRKDGSEATYGSNGPSYDLRITAGAIREFHRRVGFTLPGKQEKLDHVVATTSFYEVDRTVRMVSRESAGYETTYNLTEPRNHSYIVGGTVVANCSEYVHLDNSSCNLASINLMKFLGEDDSFDVKRFQQVTELIITAMDISICFADFPTEKISATTRAFRQLGIGYANLGALLMATGHAYDSEGGRAIAAAITSLMTGTAYRRSTELAGVVGPYDGYERNASAHKRVMRMHSDACGQIRTLGGMDRDIHTAAVAAWKDCLALGETNGYRNAQASLLAPTGCLTGDTLVTTDRGLTRLSELGDVHGDRWQDTELTVSTDEGPRQATKFFVNGEEPTRRVRTESGYQIQGTLTHRIKVVRPGTGEWVWTRLADLAPGDVVPLQLGTLVGAPRQVPLPVPDQAYYTGDHHLRVPGEVTAGLAELVGYFMGDGSLHAKGIRLCVTDADMDVAEWLGVLAKELFGITPVVTAQEGYHEVTLQSVRLARWWQAAGFAKDLPRVGHTGKGWVPRVPSAILETNDPVVYGAFLSGLFEADGTVLAGVPSVSTAHAEFAAEIRSLLLSLGLATTTRRTTSGSGGDIFQVRLRNVDHALSFDEIVGFIGERKSRLMVALEPDRSAKKDYVYLPADVWAELVPAAHALHGGMTQSLRKAGGVPRRLARRLFEETLDGRLAAALGYLFETVAANEDGGVQPTFDLSVPDNVTYVANGLVSHNTIGLMMDCDTTGVEPDLALVKFKKLVGGGSMQIVNQTVPRALKSLGYQVEQVEAITEYIAEHGHVVDAPGLRPEHYEVFDCAMGERAISPMGHVRMMAAVQPALSGAISKCVVGDTLVASSEGLVRIGSLHRGEPADSFREERLVISSLDGDRKTDAFYYGGTRPVRRVTLRSGHTITGTLPHRLLVAGTGALAWKALADITEGDAVALQYGAEMWAPAPADLRGFVVSPPHGNQKLVTLPEEMSEELAFLLGAYASEGHTTRSNWTITITNSVPEVLERVQRAWLSVFGLRARIAADPGKCPAVVVSSKAVAEFMTALGCGSRASDKRIPDAVLRSPRAMVMAFLQGLALDAYVTTATAPKWAICLDTPGLLDDLQAVMTNLGVLSGRITKHNKINGKDYDEVYAAGTQGQLMVSLVPFLEPDKAARAAGYLQMDFKPGTPDVVPGISGRELHQLIPLSQRGVEHGMSWRNSFTFLLDPRTQQVTRSTLERVSALPGVELPGWLRQVIDGNLHFSPVAAIDDAGEAEVFDLSVPETHAFVANGIVNHNTVNLPESATVEDIESIYLEGWKLGLKALAVYRDNCKVGQPLSDARKKPETAAATAAPAAHATRPVRKRLPKQRPATVTRFSVAGAEGYMTASSYPDDGVGEVFLKLGKQGSTLAGVMDAFSVAISISLQYGVPLEKWVEKFTNMRFEPAGVTDDPDIRIASSVMDYVFRRLALDHLPFETRAEMGILSAAERAAQLAGEDPAALAEDEDTTEMAQSVPVEHRHETTAPAERAAQPVSTPEPAAGGQPAPSPQPPASLPPAAEPLPAAVPQPHSSMEVLESQQGRTADAPLCLTCGTKMRPAGSCYVCEGCGATSGCS
jgi:ribonucleoside-diphosphate reductase alpha chain